MSAAVVPSGRVKESWGVGAPPGAVPGELPSPVGWPPGPRAGGRPRYHELDALRGILMTLGVVLHAGAVYAAGGRWLVTDPDGAPFFAGLVYSLHLFRVPAFFIISGFFSRMLLEERGVPPFARERAVRILVPLVGAALLLNTAQGLLLAARGRVSFAAYVAHGGLVSHLWFLLDLAVYTLAVAVAWPLLRRVRPERLPVLGGALVLALPLADLAARALGRLAPGWYLLPGQALGFGELLHYLPFFAFGFAYQPAKDGRRLGRLALGAAVLFPLGVAGELARPGKVLEVYSHAALEWSLSLFCLFLGGRWLNRKSAALRRLSDASYSVYLFHHPLVVALGLALLAVPFGPWVKFLVVAAGAYTASLAVHFFLVRPYPVLRLLFNGKGREVAKPKPVAPADGTLPAAVRVIPGEPGRIDPARG